MRKFNLILTYIFIVSMFVATIGIMVAFSIYSPGELLGDLFCYYVLIMIAATIGLIIPICNDNDLYEGYIPEPDHSEEYERVQRILYEAENQKDFRSTVDYWDLHNTTQY